MDYTSSFSIPSETNPGTTFEIHKPSHGRRVEFDRLNADFRERMRKVRKRADAIRDEIQRQRDEWNTATEKRLADLKADDATDHSAAIERLNNGLEMERLRSILVNLPSGQDEATTRPILEMIVAAGRNAETFVVPAELAEEQQDLHTETTLLIEGAYKQTRIRWGLKSVDGLTINGAPATAESLIYAGPPDLVVEIYNAIEQAGSFSSEQLKNSQWPITSNVPADGSKTNTTATNASSEDTIADETAGNSQN